MVFNSPKPPSGFIGDDRQLIEAIELAMLCAAIDDAKIVARPIELLWLLQGRVPNLKIHFDDEGPLLFETTLRGKRAYRAEMNAETHRPFLRILGIQYSDNHHAFNGVENVQTLSDR